MCMSAYVSMHHIYVQYLWKPEERVGSSGTGILNAY